MATKVHRVRRLAHYREMERKRAARWRAAHPERRREIRRRHESRRVRVHEGPGGRILMPTVEQAEAGRQYVRCQNEQLQVAQAAGRKVS